jgi:FG-GAP repeat
VTNDEFGYSVAISGDHIAVGAPDHSTPSSLCGEAYYFTKPVFGGWSGTISETASLGNGHNKNAFLGTSVGISGQDVIVGSPGEDAAYLLICAINVPSCGLDATFYGVAGPEPQFGMAVAMSGTTFVVTDPYATVGANQFQGAAYVYTYIGHNSFAKATLTSSDGGFLDEMGMSVAISNNTVVVGCPFCMKSGFVGPGAAYLYTKPQTGWADATQTAKLTSSDGVSQDYLGMGVAVSGSVIVAGAPNKTIGQNAQQGEAYVYIQPAGGWRDQTENIRLLASDGALFDYFGDSVATNGAVAVVGAQSGKNTNNRATGTTYVYSQ